MVETIKVSSTIKKIDEFKVYIKKNHLLVSTIFKFNNFKSDFVKLLNIKSEVLSDE